MIATQTDVLDRFEKSLYDLIRGLRNHKGSEKDYIQNSIRECRTEIKGQDIGLLGGSLTALATLMVDLGKTSKLQPC